jgi:hypothetical protein
MLFHRNARESGVGQAVVGHRELRFRPKANFVT